VLVLRLYNGDIEEDPLDYLNLLASISQVRERLFPFDKVDSTKTIDAYVQLRSLNLFYFFAFFSTRV